MTLAALQTLFWNCLQTGSLPGSLAQQGRELVERKYTWDAVVADLNGFYDRLLAPRRDSPVATPQ